MIGISPVAFTCNATFDPTSMNLFSEIDVILGGVEIVMFEI